MAPKKNKKLPTTDEGKFNSYKHNIKRKYELINEFIDYKIVNVANYKPDEDSNYQDTININKTAEEIVRMPEPGLCRSVRCRRWPRRSVPSSNWRSPGGQR